MKKNYSLLLFAILCFAGKVIAQSEEALPCYSDEHFKQHVAEHPEILQIKEDFDKQIKEGLKRINYNRIAKRTTTDQSGNQSFWYDIPVVVHVIHDYNNTSEYLADDAIFNDLLDWNIVYAKENYDTSSVISIYAGNIPNSHTRYIGNAHIRLHFATRDPNGNPTHGITRHRSYLTYNAGDYAKFDDWPPTSYVNLWVANNITTNGGDAAAYAQFPSEESTFPATDGVISDYGYFANAYTSGPAVSKTINHELGHFFNLLHPWNNNGGGGGQVATACGDDNVDDTPPTKGQLSSGCGLTSAALYDSTCAVNYFKTYVVTAPDGSTHDSLVNYPDTVNSQNIMDYSYCARMFTAGQVARMHAALNSNIGDRNNLWDTTNLKNTGVWDANYNFLPRPDLKPIPDFSATKGGSNYMARLGYFTFPGSTVTFSNESWNDTITNLTWTFSNGASVPTSTSTGTFQNTFSDPGWVTLTMTATGNHTGDSTITWPNAVFVADSVGTPGQNVFQEFAPTGDVAKWPFFNYYNNEFKWQIANTGMYDNYSLKYTGFDNRINPAIGAFPVTGPPKGDVDDFFTIPVDLRTYSVGHCSLNFDYSGASRSSNSLDITDTLEIDFTVNKGATWTYLTILSKGSLNNKGAVSTAYTPTSPSDWAHQSIDIPAAAISNGAVVFRFQYRPGVGQAQPNGVQYSSGNNFFIDRIHFSSFPSSVGNVNLNKTDIAVVPNPTNGDAYVVLKDADNTVAKIIVTDITGKVVYTTSQQVTDNTAQIQIPHAAISVAGMYIIQATTGTKSYTQKLVVY